MIQRRKPLRRKTPLKRGGPIRRVSAKRQREGKIYAEKRREFLAARPRCELCLQNCKAGGPLGRLSQDVHHTKGRLAGNYLDETTWMAVCREHHTYIHEHPAEAREKGWLK